MHTPDRHRLLKLIAAACLSIGLPLSGPAFAAPDEIQVYTDDMDAPGDVGLELHINYVPKGAKTPSYRGEMISNHRLQVTPEFSYGFTKELEGGLYLPFALSGDGNFYNNGLRLRLKYIAEQPENSAFFWGLNTELGYFTRRVSDSTWGMELRPIWGVRWNKWTFDINPIIDLPLSTGGIRSAAFEPAVKLSREVAHGVELGIEHYSGLGPLRDLSPASQQEHSVYAVADVALKGMELNVGICKGYKNTEDEWVMKAIVAMPID